MRASIVAHGDFSKTEGFFKKMSEQKLLANIEKFAAMGVAALAAGTPKRSGVTASSWGYEIDLDKNTITWTNSHMAGTAPLVILLQYGHGTRNGGYVQGIDFINPAMKPVFDQIADGVWKVVTTA